LQHCSSATRRCRANGAGAPRARGYPLLSGRSPDMDRSDAIERAARAAGVASPFTSDARRGTPPANRQPHPACANRPARLGGPSAIIKAGSDSMPLPLPLPLPRPSSPLPLLRSSTASRLIRCHGAIAWTGGPCRSRYPRAIHPVRLYPTAFQRDGNAAGGEDSMSNSRAGEEEEEEEEGKGRGEEEEEEFYESLDRILSSSSCSSASASASDDDGDHPHRHRRYGHHQNGRAPRFPAASMYEVWISEPSSVEERRRRLLHQMGLIGDPAVSRRRRAGQGDGADEGGNGGGEREQAARLRAVRLAEMGRSVSCDGLHRRQDHLQSPSCCAIARSRSDGAVDANSGGGPAPPTSLVHKQHPSPNKPPIAKSSSSGGNINDSHESDGGREDSSGGGDHRQPRCDLYCTIKNLDNGEEFVVKEVREDGMWNKLREVGTGRQLTMEEFQFSVIGHSPIVQELMRRQNVEDVGGGKRDGSRAADAGPVVNGLRSKKKGSWLKSIKNVAGTVVQRMERRSSDERETSSEKGGRRSSSATDDSQDTPLQHCPERVKVRHYGKSWKELTGLYISQEIRAHNGSIWSIKFSFDGRYLASAGEDCVIHVWQVIEMERKGDLLLERVATASLAEDVSVNPFCMFSNGSPEPVSLVSSVDTNNGDKKRRAKAPSSRKSFSFDQIVVPENVFALSEKPVCSFRGHREDVLDLSWSKSEYLLSSSMDKTVRLWHMSSDSCLKIFSHSDYVTCIQFNPVDDNYFISGSLDAKVRIWSIHNRQVVDWKDVHEMVTAACYTPDGQGACVGSHKGGCHIYDTSDNKLHLKSQIDLQSKKKKSHYKKITGFQFVPGSSSEVVITSADSRIRVVDGLDLVHKFKGTMIIPCFQNTSSQISASLTPDGKYVVCASEDSYVFVWRYDASSRPSRSKGAVAITQSYEHFHCQDVSVAVAWPGTSPTMKFPSHRGHQFEESTTDSRLLCFDEEANGHGISLLPRYYHINSPRQRTFPNANSIHFCDRVSATWPEEKLLTTAKKQSPGSGVDLSNGLIQTEGRPAWGMVIVTAGRGGEIRIYQNFGCPFRV
ncbi:hypothetical protein Taro_010670, partial [Colocasia esculenta]|nr:hypothetical protein [Colocasia esculenta]